VQIQTLDFKVVSYSRVSGEEEYSPVIMEYVSHVSGKGGEYWNCDNERVVLCVGILRVAPYYRENGVQCLKNGEHFTECLCNGSLRHGASFDDM